MKIRTMKKGLVKIVILCGFLCLVVWWFRTTMYGDATAPVQCIRANWLAAITITTNEPVVRVEMSGSVLKADPDQPARIPLFPRNTVFKNLQLNGQPLTPVRQDDWFCAELSRPAKFTLSAELVIKPEYDRGEHRIRFAKPEFVQSIVNIDSEYAFEVNIPGVLGVVTGSPEQGTHGALTIGSLRDVTVAWHKPLPTVSRTGTASVTPSIAWTIRENILSADAILETNIEGGRADSMTILLPEGADNIQLRGIHVRDLRIRDRELVVFFKGSIAGRTSMRLSFDTPRSAGNVFTCPALEISGGRIDTGGSIIIVKDLPGILLEQNVTGLEPVSDLDVPPQVLGLVSGKPAYIYRSTARQSGPVFDLVTTTPFPLVETIADRADILTVIRPGGEEITRIRYKIRNNAQQFLRMIMPEGSEILFARVDNVTRKISTDGRQTLIPLAKSVQTLGGLIPFPVEIVYCRQDNDLSRHSSKLVDLPELEDIPTAAINVTVMCPEDTAPNGYNSSLRKVDAFAMQGDLWWIAAVPGADTNLPSSLQPDYITRNLAYNYYQAGYEAYQGNRLEEAETYLAGATQLGTGADWDKSAGDLLDNIRAGRGELTTDDRLQRARISKIRDELTTENPRLEAEQEALIQGGLANIDEGDEELGLELLDEALRVGAKLTQRSDSVQRQKAINRKYEEQLRKVEEDRNRNKDLNEQLQQLQAQAAQVAGPQAAREPQRARDFAATLAKEAQSESLSVAELQDAAFGNVLAADSYEQPQQVSARAQARSYQRDAHAKSGPKVSSASRTARETKGSLSEQNWKLEQKVKVLKKAVAASGSIDSRLSPPTEMPDDHGAAIKSIRDKVVGADRKVDELLATLNQPEQGGVLMNDMTVERELREIEKWTDANRTTWGALDRSTDAEFGGLKEKIQGAKDDLAEARYRRMNATNILIDVSGILGQASQGKQESLKRFLLSNGYVVPAGDGFEFTISEGMAIVPNSGDNPASLNAAVENWLANKGQVVPVAGKTVRLPSVTNMAVIGENFSNATAGGRNYAVLDEAQYRTLVQSADALRNNSSASPSEQRQVIVGTTNSVATEDFQIARSDADYNDIQIDGTRISLPNDKYLAIDNGDSLSVLKAGEVRDWQDDATEVQLETPESCSVDLPETGIALRFEKMLLSAGESADIEMLL